MKKLITVLLLCAMLLSVFAACKKEEAQPEATTSPTTSTQEGPSEEPSSTQEEPSVPSEEPSVPSEETSTPSEEEQTPPVSDLILFSNGQTEFRIVYNEMEAAKNDILDQGIKTLISTFKEVTGVQLKKVATSKNTYDANAYEIFIGSTGYEESLSAAEDFRLTDYKILRNGNKIVIVGGNIASLYTAISYFTSKIISDQGKENSGQIVFGTAQERIHRGTYRHELIEINGVDLKDYTIVIPKGYTMAETDIAHYFSATIATRYGYDIPIEYDTKEYEHEILIGNTKRTTVKPSTQTEYLIEITDKNVQISAGCIPCYSYLSNILSRAIINGKIENLKVDAYDQYVTQKDSLLGAEGELRIIFHNVLAYSHPDRSNDYMGPNLRWQLQADLYKEYKPDLLCLQEFNNLPRMGSKGVTVKLTAMGYKEVPFENPEHGDTPIFYNPEKVELLKYGSYDYKTPNNDNERYGGIAKMATWGIFKDKTTGKRFVLFSAHLDHQDAADANERRALEALELLDLINNTICVGEYADLPVILGGDINTSYNRENNKYGNTGALHNFEAAGFKDAQKTLDFAEKINTWGGYPSYDSSKGFIVSGNSYGTDSNDSIDHCLYKGNVTFHCFDVMDHEYARKASDHLPIVVDITLPE